MKELLYLKDNQLKELIERLFTSYKDSFADAKKTLDKYSIGIAHHGFTSNFNVWRNFDFWIIKKVKNY